MLGGLAVVQGERRITRFQTQKTGALLAYLALQPGRSHSREAVAELLWPDGDPVAIRNRLNQAISSLRRQLHPPELGPGTVLATDHHSLAVNGQTVITDIEEFEKDIRSAERAESDEERVRWLKSAVERYKGELLEGYYEEWIFPKRVHLADMYDQALQQLIRSYVALGTPEAAIEYARRRLELDPYDEAPHVVLMRLYLRAGRAKSALLQFDELLRALQQYDDEPSERALKYKAKAESVLADQVVDVEIDDDFSPQQARKVSEPVSVIRNEATLTLPRVVSSFVGRESEIRLLEEYLVTRSSRVVTVLGLGGCGKTRLAIEAGWLLREHFQDRVYFVSLGSVEDGADVPVELARALLPGQVNLTDPWQAILARLAELPNGLLILDNLEQISESGAEVVQKILGETAKVQILVTSRVPLNIEAESLISLTPLSVPSQISSDLKELAENPSVALFVDRAQAVKADFQLTDRTSEAIVELSRRLEGLPLALELAAGWARAMTPAQMIEQLNANVDRLASRRKDISPRHRSLRAVFDGSYHLLDESLRKVFLRLTFFEGGWDHASAEHLCPDDNVMEALTALEERSLIYSEPTDDTVRFSMLGIVRSFGQSMVTPDLFAECGWRHAECFLDLAEKEPSSTKWASSIDADYLNCVAALRWLNDHDLSEELLRLSISLARYWESRGYIAEGREWLEAALRQETIDPLLKAKATASLGKLDWLAGDFKLAESRIHQALEVFGVYGSKAEIIAANFVLQMEAHRKGSYEEAKQLLRANQTLSAEIGDLASEARCWLALGNVAMEAGDRTSAQADYEQSLEVARKLGNPERIGSALTNLANLAVDQGMIEPSEKWIDEAIELFELSGHRWYQSMAMVVKGRVANAAGDYQKASQSLIASYRNAENELLVVWRFLLYFGQTLHGLGYVNDSARVFGLLEVYRARMGELHHGIEMRRYDEYLAQLRDGMDLSRFEEQLEIGRKMSMEEIDVIISKVQRNF